MEKDFVNSVSKIILRELDKLEGEINQYPTEETIWKIDGAIKNSAGNLCLHLCGNLQHYIGANLGNTGYIRNRDHEFAARGISKNELIAEINRTKSAVKRTLEGVDVKILDQEYPEKVFNYTMTTTFFFVHLTAHLQYHLGQINYHRRLLA